MSSKSKAQRLELRSMDISLSQFISSQIHNHNTEAMRHPTKLLLQVTGDVSTPPKCISSRSDVAAATANRQTLTGSQN